MAGFLWLSAGSNPFVSLLWSQTHWIMLRSGLCGGHSITSRTPCSSSKAFLHVFLKLWHSTAWRRSKSLCPWLHIHLTMLICVIWEKKKKIRTGIQPNIYIFRSQQISDCVALRWRQEGFCNISNLCLSLCLNNPCDLNFSHKKTTKRKKHPKKHQKHFPPWFHSVTFRIVWPK